MKDDRMERLRRAFEADGGVDTAFAYVRALLQSGRVTRSLVQSCALLGDEACIRIMGQEGGLIQEGMKLTRGKLFMACTDLSHVEWILIAAESLLLLNDPDGLMRDWSVIARDLAAGEISLETAQGSLAKASEEAQRSQHAYESPGWFSACFLTLLCQENQDAAWDIFQETMTALAGASKPEENAFGWQEIIAVARRVLFRRMLP